jgi:hypothetical protein
MNHEILMAGCHPGDGTQIILHQKMTQSMEDPATASRSKEMNRQIGGRAFGKNDNDYTYMKRK